MSDQFDGVGGSYVLDPKTGKRKLIERTTVEITGEVFPKKFLEEQLIPAINEAVKKP